MFMVYDCVGCLLQHFFFFFSLMLSFCEVVENELACFEGVLGGQECLHGFKIFFCKFVLCIE